jgi:hypothetical protein
MSQKDQMKLEDLFPIVERLFPHTWATYHFSQSYGRKDKAFTMRKCQVDIFWEQGSPYAEWWNKTPTILTSSIEEMPKRLEQIAETYERHLKEGTQLKSSFYCYL